MNFDTAPTALVHSTSLPVSQQQQPVIMNPNVSVFDRKQSHDFSQQQLHHHHQQQQHPPLQQQQQQHQKIYSQQTSMLVGTAGVATGAAATTPAAQTYASIPHTSQNPQMLLPSNNSSMQDPSIPTNAVPTTNYTSFYETQPQSSIPHQVLRKYSTQQVPQQQQQQVLHPPQYPQSHVPVQYQQQQQPTAQQQLSHQHHHMNNNSNSSINAQPYDGYAAQQKPYIQQQVQQPQLQHQLGQNPIAQQQQMRVPSVEYPVQQQQQQQQQQHMHQSPNLVPIHHTNGGHTHAINYNTTTTHDLSSNSFQHQNPQPQIDYRHPTQQLPQQLQKQLQKPPPYNNNNIPNYNYGTAQQNSHYPQQQPQQLQLPQNIQQQQQQQPPPMQQQQQAQMQYQQQYQYYPVQQQQPPQQQQQPINNFDACGLVNDEDEYDNNKFTTGLMMDDEQDFFAQPLLYSYQQSTDYNNNPYSNNPLPAAQGIPTQQIGGGGASVASASAQKEKQQKGNQFQGVHNHNHVNDNGIDEDGYVDDEDDQLDGMVDENVDDSEEDLGEGEGNVDDDEDGEDDENDEDFDGEYDTRNGHSAQKNKSNMKAAKQSSQQQQSQSKPQQQIHSSSGQFDGCSGAILVPVKRGRGRPRKYPLPMGVSGNGAGDEACNANGETPSTAGSVIGVDSREDLKRQEALHRKKYKEEMMRRSQQVKSDSEEEEDDSDNEKIDEKNYVVNSEFLQQFKQRLIGRSSNSKIFELRDPITNELTGQVVKEVPHKMSNLHQSECFELKNEFSFLKKLSHPRVIGLGTMKEFIRDRNFCGVHLPQAKSNLMQYAKSQRHGKISLEYIRIAFRQTAEAIFYLHENYISHNDIKPDNIFIFEDDDFKLADFGFAKDLPKPNAFKHNSSFSQSLRKQAKIENLKRNWRLRCKQYVAPELIKLLNGKRPRSPSDERSCDIFALGVTFFIVIFYQLPFCGCALPTDQRYKHFFKGQFDKFWSQFTSMLSKFAQQSNSHTEELKDLFNKTLEPNPDLRLNIEQVLEHPWLNH